MKKKLFTTGCFEEGNEVQRSQKRRERIGSHVRFEPTMEKSTPFNYQERKIATTLWFPAKGVDQIMANRKPMSHVKLPMD